MKTKHSQADVRLKKNVNVCKMDKPCSFKNLNKNISCSADKISLGAISDQDRVIALSEFGLIFGPTSESFFICKTHLAKSKQNHKARLASPLCGIPSILCNHDSKRKRERHINENLMEKIRQCTGMVIPIGTGVCACCRHKLTISFKQHEVCQKDEATETEDDLSCMKPTENEKCIHEEMQDCERHSQEQPYVLSGSISTSQTVSDSQQSQSSVCNQDRLNMFNQILLSFNKSPVKQIQTSLTACSERTQRRYTSKVKDCVRVLCETFCPGEGNLLHDMFISTIGKNMQSSTENTAVLLADIYKSAETWTFKRQILSILAEDYNFDALSQLIPDLSSWRYYAAKRHSTSKGCGVPVATEKIPRNKINLEQLEHFLDFITSSDILKDIPFGEKTLKLSSGEVIHIPNVVRCMAPSSLIDQYQQLCESEEFHPLGTSTLYKILNECSASVRKSMEGIDYFAAEASRGFQTLDEIIGQLNIPNDKVKELRANLLDGKQYLKSDYKVHIDKSSQVADHCRAFALSDQDHSYSMVCEHQHEVACSRCNMLDNVLVEIQTQCHKTEWPNREAAVFQVQHAIDSIKEMKSHLMRSKNQEEARTKLLDEMTESDVIITCDWAMKFLPRKFREGQTDWFGKRGINWHAAVTLSKRGGAFQTITHIHIFSSQVAQDSTVTAYCICDVAKDVMMINPVTENIHIFTDNAGCYKSTSTLAILKKELKENIKSFNFCEAQNGKGPCDRRASHVKGCIKRYINEGNDVTSASEMKIAIDKKQKGNYRVKVVETITDLDPEKPNIKQITGISQLYNFQFHEDSIRMWKAFGIGEGKEVMLNMSTVIVPANPLKVVHDWSDSIFQIFENRDTEDTDECHFPPSKKRRMAIFDCPEDGCSRSFSSSGALDQHLLLGSCNYKLEKMCLKDQAKFMYGERIHNLCAINLPLNVESQTESAFQETSLRKGWSLKGKKKRTIFSDKQKSFMISLFESGKRTGSKIDPFDVAKAMQSEKNDEKFVFTSEEYLTGQQISSFFSRLNMKDKSMDILDFRALQVENEKSKLKYEVLNAISE